MRADLNLSAFVSALVNKFLQTPLVLVLKQFFKTTPDFTMSFSSLVQDLSFRDANSQRRPQRTPTESTMDDRRSHISRAMSYASTSATSVSISGDISSQLHGGYSHPLARSWQAERQLTKVGSPWLSGACCSC
jgi:porphobilinogen synthase